MSCCHSVGGLHPHHAPSTQPRLFAEMDVSETFCMSYSALRGKTYVHHGVVLRSSKISNTERRDHDLNIIHHHYHRLFLLLSCLEKLMPNEHKYIL